MRFLSLLLLLLLCCIGGASADPMPSLVWAGDSTVTYSGSDGEFWNVSPNDVATGIDTAASCGNLGGDCSVDFTVDGTFTVTSPGDFLLSTAVTFSGNSSNCNPGDCDGLSPAEMSATLYGFTGLSTAPGGFFQTLSDSASNSVACAPVSICFVSLAMDDSASNIVDLGLGTYTLVQQYQLEPVYADGDDSWNADFNTSLLPAPVPEPRGAIAFLALALLAVLGLRRGNLHVLYSSSPGR
jgi:hypothetical protein